MSEEDKRALIDNTAAIKCKIIVQEDGDLPEIVLTEEDAIKDWEYTDDRIVPGQDFIGQFVGRTLDGNLHNISSTFDITNREIKLMFGVYRINDDVTTWYDFGNFIVTEPEDNKVNDNTKFESMDYTKLFNKSFDGDFTDEEFTDSYNDRVDPDNAAYSPVTALWLAQYTCKQVGVELATTTFINHNFSIDINPFRAGETCRDVMKAIGQLAVSWIRIGWDNRCYIDLSMADVPAGKNLLQPLANYYRFMRDNLVIEYTDKGWLLNGTLNSTITSTSIMRIGDSNQTLPAGTYVINGVQGASPSTYSLRLDIGTSSDPNRHTEYVYDEDYSFTLTDRTRVTASMGLRTTEFNNVLLPYQLELGEEPTEFLPYGISDTNIIDENQYFELSTKERVEPMDGIGFGLTNIDGETAFAFPTGLDETTAKNILYLYDNPLLYTFDLRQAAATEARRKLGINYTQLTTETIGHPWFCGNTRIGVRDMDGNLFTTIPLNNTIKYSGHIRSVINSADETKIDKTLGYTSSTLSDIRKAEYVVNKQEGTIEQLTSSVKSLDERENNNYQDILSRFEDYLPDADFTELQNTVTQLQTDTYTKTEIQQIASGIGADGVKVEAVITETGKFDIDGLLIEKENAKTKGRFNEVGMRITDATGSSDEELLFAGYDENINESIVRTKNINVTKYLSIGTKSRIEDYEDGTGVFYVG